MNEQAIKSINLKHQEKAQRIKTHRFLQLLSKILHGFGEAIPHNHRRLPPKHLLSDSDVGLAFGGVVLRRGEMDDVTVGGAHQLLREGVGREGKGEEC